MNRYQLFYKGELCDVALEQDEAGWWVASWKDLSTQGRTEEEAIDRIYEVFDLHPHRIADDADVRASIKRISAEHAGLLKALCDK